MRQLLSFLIILASFTLASCGDDNTILDPDSSTGGDGGAITPDDVTVQMGSGVPPAFTAGSIGIAVPSLAAGGSTSLTVTLVATSTNGGDQLFAEDVAVNFSSPCIASGLATITGPATTNTGILTVTYGATGCNGNDMVTANAVVSGGGLQAQGTVTIAASTVGSIEFESANPPKIGLRGTGGVGIAETSTVIFRVVDATGGPSIGRNVSFSLSSTAGGITLTPSTAISGADGRVQTTIQSGTVATSIRVTATVTDVTPNIGTQSSELVITTGLPDQDSVTMSVACSNVEALTVNGTTNEVTIRLADRNNNPVPDGTAATISTEGGVVTGSCATTTIEKQSGLCVVEWVSSNPRPADLSPSSPAGRSTIYMNTLGEESFADVDGNGFFNDGDTFTDLSEPFRDDNENSLRDPSEPFFDFNNDGIYSAGDGLFSGLLCGGPDGSLDTMARCAPNPTTAISADSIIVMSGSTAQFLVDLGDGNGFVPPAGGMSVTAPVTVQFMIGDVNNQPMPAATSVEFNLTNGDAVSDTIFNESCHDTNAPTTYGVFIGPDGTSDAGFLSVRVETPLGVITAGPVIAVND
jgi:hypothetical protein